ncbi:MAG TPA: GGDEF domain-containing protein [Candidatus Competibacteraceae bacterium]|mgnify:CR=1 FL=1|nr:GGDEF domain-containing protein [Candidatus Competibacteraceae bacterium]MCP5133934.1 GGDEF domain-containing protein [Gammaproteobacteria bacterium]HPF58355.1 GGDEF domain-containing protein [Candidatus Competibacteraceae bacterium]HRY18427.1 GGDEF domain-containing protein [Candidatus Competibacteraceae bacterium]
MFWDNKTDQKPTAPVDSSTSPGITDPALDATGALLRIWGKYAFDLDQLNSNTIKDLCEKWARHILIAAPCPGAESNNTSATGRADRNWLGLREFFTQLRKRENAYVTASLKDIRQVLGDLINTLGKVLVEDEEEQTEIVDQLNHLKNVIESNASLDAIKCEAMEVISAIGRIAESRQHMHHTVLEELTDRLKSMRAELSAARREMELDALTQLYNRKAFDQQLLRIFELGRLSSQPVCLLMVDIDHFKQINDQLGHLAGDLVLRQFADCCVQTFPRRSDFVARYGGEEFAMILQETAMDAAGMLGERLLQAARNLCPDYQGHKLCFTVSVGIAELSVTDENTSSWLQRADSALYRAKQGGRDRLVKGLNI